jgi:hypothetical protein
MEEPKILKTNAGAEQPENGENKKATELELAKEALEIANINQARVLLEHNIETVEQFYALKESTEKGIQDREDIVIESELRIKQAEAMMQSREIAVNKAAVLNDNVKRNLIDKEIKASQHRIAMKEYAIRTYWENLDLLFKKIKDGIAGKNAIGLVSKGDYLKPSKYKDEPVCMDSAFKDELWGIIVNILPALDKSPRFNDVGEYMTDDEIANAGEDGDDTNEPDTDIPPK